MKLVKVVCFALVLCLAAVSVHSQQAKNEAPLTNNDVLQMVSLGLSEGIVVDKIHTAQATNFDTSLDALKSLKDAKVPDGVIQAMIRGSAAAPAPPNPNDPASPHSAGVWILVDGKMSQIDASTFSGSNNNTGKTMLTMGMSKNRTTTSLNKAHAAVQLAGLSPEFYFYFDPPGTQQQGFSMNAPPTSPGNYQLIHLEVKKDTRETTLMTAGGLGGGSSNGPDKKDIMEFSASKIGDRSYKVTVTKPLAPGEYCFKPTESGMASMMATGNVYDFGVSAGK